MAPLQTLHNVSAFRGAAARALPRPIFDFMDGGAEDEVTLRSNCSAFQQYGLVPRICAGSAENKLATPLLGGALGWPLMLSPTGMSRLFHRDAEPAVARAAASHGLLYSLSAMGTTSIEDLSAAVHEPFLFQIYIFRDRGLTREFVARCREAGVSSLAVTMDTPVAGNRERDKRHGLSLPPRLTPRAALSFALHPRWSIGALTGAPFELANLSHKLDGLSGGAMALFDYIDRQFDPTLSWRDVEWLADEWNGPLAVKGLLHPADAKQAIACGASAIIASNHGGRQLDGALAPVRQLSAIREAIGSDAELICDGGVRRGSDIVKAIALGANAVSIGRPYLWGLAAGGEAGVTRVLDILREELERTLILLGVDDIARLGREHIRNLPELLLER